MADPATAATLTVDLSWALCEDMIAAHADRPQPALRARLEL